MSENQTPWWWGSALTGAFVVVASIIAFISLRASDRRKLAREDSRQWDGLLKDGYMEVATVLNDLLRLQMTHDTIDELKPHEASSVARSMVRVVRGRAAEFELIAPRPAALAMKEVADAADALAGDLPKNLNIKGNEARLQAAERNLLAEVKKSMRLLK
ncbi:hypothetical protein [Conyzicola sp.]|uniref:hypothetical protein n=1 Tax=Conyzicola sp. TaxID=1969404 RepID=UPI003989F56D